MFRRGSGGFGGSCDALGSEAGPDEESDDSFGFSDDPREPLPSVLEPSTPCRRSGTLGAETIDRDFDRDDLHPLSLGGGEAWTPTGSVAPLEGLPDRDMAPEDSFSEERIDDLGAEPRGVECSPRDEEHLAGAECVLGGGEDRCPAEPEPRAEAVEAGPCVCVHW